MTGKRIQFFAMATVLVFAGSAMAGSERVRNGQMGSADAAPRKVEVTATPKSFSEYAEALKAGLISGPPAPKAAFRSTGQSVRVIRNGAGQDNVGDIRGTLPCGTYDDSLAFDADHGPFTVNTDYEDLDTAPGLGDDVGSPGYCAFDDGSNNPDLDCQQTLDTASWTTCTASDAGDIANGIGMDNGPGDRGSTWWEMLATQPGFLGFADITLLPNYFGDSHDVTFPVATPPDPDGCGNDTLNKPNVFAATYHSPFGTDNVTMTVHLVDGTDIEYDLGGADVGGDFKGLCCSQGIDSVQFSDTGSGGTSVGLDDYKWHKSTGVCEFDLEPVTLDMLFEGLECLEMKLDAIGTGGGGSSSSAQ